MRDPIGSPVSRNASTILVKISRERWFNSVIVVRLVTINSIATHSAVFHPALIWAGFVLTQPTPGNLGLGPILVNGLGFLDLKWFQCGWTEVICFVRFLYPKGFLKGKHVNHIEDSV